MRYHKQNIEAVLYIQVEQSEGRFQQLDELWSISSRHMRRGTIVTDTVQPGNPDAHGLGFRVCPVAKSLKTVRSDPVLQQPNSPIPYSPCILNRKPKIRVALSITLSPLTYKLQAKIDKTRYQPVSRLYSMITDPLKTCYQKPQKAVPKNTHRRSLPCS